MRQQAVSEAKQLLYQSEVGVISTLSKNLRGYPFGSVSPFISADSGEVYFYISDIAQHAKNLNHDSRMSLTIFDQANAGDQNTHGRVTVVGDASVVENSAMLARYFLRYPESRGYQNTHDFKLWKMSIKRVRYIGGFGKIFWLEKDEWLAPDTPWDAAAEQGMIQHMDEDHRDAMSLILKQHTGAKDANPSMSGVMADGCYIRSGEKNHYIAFESRCKNATDVRKALIKLTTDAREYDQPAA